MAYDLERNGMEGVNVGIDAVHDTEAQMVSREEVLAERGLTAEQTKRILDATRETFGKDEEEKPMEKPAGMPEADWEKYKEYLESQKKESEYEITTDYEPDFGRRVIDPEQQDPNTAVLYSSPADFLSKGELEPELEPPTTTPPEPTPAPGVDIISDGHTSYEVSNESKPSTEYGQPSPEPRPTDPEPPYGAHNTHETEHGDNRIEFVRPSGMPDVAWQQYRAYLERQRDSVEKPEGMPDHIWNDIQNIKDGLSEPGFENDHLSDGTSGSSSNQVDGYERDDGSDRGENKPLEKPAGMPEADWAKYKEYLESQRESKDGVSSAHDAVSAQDAMLGSLRGAVAEVAVPAGTAHGLEHAPEPAAAASRIMQMAQSAEATKDEASAETSGPEF